MSNPDCKAGCGIICTCGDIDFSRENELSVENATLKADRARLMEAFEVEKKSIRESAYRQGRMDADRDNDAKIRGCLV